MIAVKQEANKSEKSEVVHELEFAINLALYGLLLQNGGRVEIWFPPFMVKSNR